MLFVKMECEINPFHVRILSSQINLQDTGYKYEAIERRRGHPLTVLSTFNLRSVSNHQTFTCSKSSIETLLKGVKYVHS